MKWSYAALVVLFLFISCSSPDATTETGQAWSFQRVDSSDSGISFSNDITPDVSTKANLFDYDYFYNGAGVAVIDVNNDDLPDLFFTANQVENRLYLNKGDLEFEDITASAGINAGKHWSNGVTTVDINQDGFMDIYISQGGPHESAERKNLLYINNGDLTFKEAAADYGLADTGISTQSAFFDYDMDGDLDCVVMNENLLYGYDPVTFRRLNLEHPLDVYESYTHFYRNDEGQYIDVTTEVGFDKATFGLGLVISDINNDNYPDIYIANDYYQPDNLYINRKNGTFSDRIKTHLKQTSFYGMGADIADINNDGHQDICVLDMASSDHYRSKTLMASMDVESFDLLVNKFGYINQYMFNSLQLSDRQGRFNNVAHKAKVAKTDWSWTALMEDVDLDGDRDLFVTNGYRQYALDNDFKNKVNKTKEEYNGNVPLEIKEKLYQEMPTEPLANILYQNDGDLNLHDVAQEVGLVEETYSNGAVLVDLDLDGDQDLVINNIDQTALIYKNNASDTHNYLTVKIAREYDHLIPKVRIRAGGQKQMAEIKKVRGYRSSLAPIAHFGLNKNKMVDEIEITWPNGKVQRMANVKVNQTIIIKPEDATESSVEDDNRRVINPLSASGIGLAYSHQENDFNDFAKEVLLPQKQSTMGPPLTTGDVNGDGLEDIYIGGAHGQAGEIYIQADGRYSRIVSPAFLADADHEDVGAVFFDLENDGDLDLYVQSGGNEWSTNHPLYQDRIYINDGTGSFAKSEIDLGATAYVGAVVKAADFDQNGYKDLFIGNRIMPQSYPVAAPSMMLKNEAGVLSPDEKSSVYLADQKEIVNDAVVMDYDKDGWLDLITVGEWSGIRFYHNDGGSLKLDEKYKEYADLTGWWYSIATTDVNKDGHIDLIVGNVGENIKHKASNEKPFNVYATDFDQTGTIDVVLSSTYKNRSVPVRGKECSSQQMPFILDKFETYDEFASASLVDIYGEENLEQAYQRSATTFKSYILINDGSGNFKKEGLPTESQLFPLMGIEKADLNNDGYEDLLLAGAIFNTEVETPRLDAGTGLVLLSDQKSNYLLGDCPEYCFYVPGNIKQLQIVDLDDQPILLAIQNNAPLNAYSLK